MKLDAVVIDGAALALLGVIDRPTRDFDIVQPELSDEVNIAAQEFAQYLCDQGIELDTDWLNNRPSQVAEILPDGWQNRLRPLFVGEALALTTLSRSDLLKTKLFALCDRGTDLVDCLALSPTDIELSEAMTWLEIQDANPMWPRHVRDTLRDLSES